MRAANTPFPHCGFPLAREWGVGGYPLLFPYSLGQSEMLFEKGESPAPGVL